MQTHTKGKSKKFFNNQDMEKKFTDHRINNMLSMSMYGQIANEYCQREFGRNISGGCSMTWETFETQSYAKDCTEKQIDICITYKDQSITLRTR